jgi:hypothetical protein
MLYGMFQGCTGALASMRVVAKEGQNTFAFVSYSNVNYAMSALGFFKDSAAIMVEKKKYV